MMRPAMDTRLAALNMRIALKRRILHEYRKVRFSAAPPQHSPIATEVSGSRYSPVSRVAVDQLSLIRLSRCPHMSLADRSAAGHMRRYFRHRSLPSEALEFLSRRRTSTPLCGLDGRNYDLVSSRSPLLQAAALTLRKAGIPSFHSVGRGCRMSEQPTGPQESQHA